jgi:hypothetical protein
VTASQALDGENFPSLEARYRGGDGIFHGNAFAAGIEQEQMRAAHRAGVGFGMEAPACRVAIF